MKNIKEVQLFLKTFDSKDSIVTYETSFKLFIDFFGTKDLNDFLNITEMDMETFNLYLKEERNNNSSTRETRIRCIRSFYNWLIGKKVTTNNPCESIKNKKETVLVKYLDEDESVRVISACDNTRDKAIFSLMLTTGIRYSEMTNIRLDDFNKSDYKIVIQGKGNKERNIYILDYVCGFIEEYLKDRKGDSDFLFTNKRGTKLNDRSQGLNDILKNIAKNAGIIDSELLSVHKLRHSFISGQLERGVDIKTIADSVGHSDPSLTLKRYSHSSEKRVEQSMRFNNLKLSNNI